MQTEPVQNFLVKKITNKLSHDLKTEVRIRHVSFTLFDRMNLDGTLIRDLNKDTLLYAGALKLRISDWFFLKKNIDLNYIGLENAVIHTYRKDSVWNYQFLINYFSSTKKDTSSKKNIDLNLKKVDLKNVSIEENDLWVGTRTSVTLGSLLLDADNIDLNKLNFKINLLEIDKPVIVMDNFKGRRPNQLSAVSSRPLKDTGLQFNSGGIFLKADSLQITDGKFVLLNNNRPHNPVKFFDPDNIQFSHINLSARKIAFANDTIVAGIRLSTRERSGLEVKKLVANFRLTPEIMEFKNLDVITANSHLHNYYAMKFKHFNDDMNDFTNKVKIVAHFNNAIVNSNDIAFFAPELKSWNKKFTVSGDALGPVVNFSVKKLNIQDADGMRLRGDLSMKGLPDIDTTIINLENLNATTNYNQLIPIAPQLKNVNNPNLSAMGVVNYMGSFKGTIHHFFTDGLLHSALGDAAVKLNLKLPNEGEPGYDGTLITKKFNLGRFIDSKIVGNIAFNGKFTGTSFSLNTMKASLNGHFNSFEVNDYPYADIDVNGTFQKKYFTGDLTINDSSASFLSNVEIDLSGEKPRFNILGDLVNLDLKKTKLSKENIKLTALFDLNFSGNNIDDFLGDAKMLNVSISKDSNKISFDSLTLSASLDSNHYKVLRLDNNQFNAEVRGQYSILDLPTTFQSFLNKYYPAIIHKPTKVPKNQQFTMEVHTGMFDKYAHLIDSNLHGLDSIVLKGSINTQDSGNFFFNLQVPYVKYKRFKFFNTVLEGNGNFVKIGLDGTIGKFYLSDSSYFPNTNLVISSENNHSLLQLTTGSNNTINEVNIAADIYNLSDGVRIDFRPSYFVLNDKKWNLEKEGEIVIQKDFASAKNVKFSQGFQELTVATEQSRRDTSHNNLVFNLSRVNIGDITPLLFSDPRIEGLASGRILMINFFHDFSVADSLQIEQFRFNGDSVGVINTKGFYSAKTKNIRFDVNSENKSYDFTMKGHYDLNDSVADPLDVAIEMKDMRVNVINEYLSSLFNNIDGQAAGHLEVKGTLSKYKLLGQATLHKASIGVNYTQVTYYIDTANFVFNDGNIDFGNFTIKDKYNNTGTVHGILYHQSFNDMKFDFDISSPKILALDTKAIDNELFYGKAIARVDKFSLKGTQDNMSMYIKARVADTSNINILTVTDAESSDADFIVFKKYGKAIKVAKTDDSHLDINLDLTATNRATINVILDPLTGDVIKAIGSGSLSIHIPPVGNVTMKGKYNIEKGSYNFNFQTLVKRPFEFIDGANNYIEWTGDPENANLHIDAQYTAKQVSINDLINSQSSVQGETGLNNIRGYRGDVYVIVELRGKLLKPDIGFRIDFPTGSSVKSDPDFALFLSRLQSDENEMLKQVTYLIVFNSFAPYGQASGGASSFASTGVNTISSLLTNELNNVFSNALSKLTGDKGLRFELGASTYSSSSILGQVNGSDRLDRQSLNFKLYQSLANDKIIITLGSNFDFGLGNTSSTAIQNGNFQFLPDISVQFVLTRDRKLRAVIFNRSSLGVAGVTSIGRQNRYGVSISYTKDFEKFFADNRNKYKEIKMRNDTLHIDRRK